MTLFCVTNVQHIWVSLGLRCPLLKCGSCLIQLKMIVYLFVTENVIKNHIWLGSIMSVLVHVAVGGGLNRI